MSIDTTALKSAFISIHGFWTSGYQAFLEMDPEYFAGYLGMSRIPKERGALEAKERALISVAINAAPTHLRADRIREHIQQALHLGATREELIETLELSSVLGLHSISIGMPVLYAAAIEADADMAQESAEGSDIRENIKAQFIAGRGYWNDNWEKTLALSPHIVEGYLNASLVSWNRGALSNRMKELIYIAIDVSTTHLFVPGLEMHCKQALADGASVGEIVDVIILATMLSDQTLTTGLSVLQEELRLLEL